MRSVFGKVAATVFCFALLLTALNAYAAGANTLDYIPSIVKTQTTVNFVGNWSGTGTAISSGMSTITVNSLSIQAVENVTGVYKASFSYSYGQNNIMFNELLMTQAGDTLHGVVNVTTNNLWGGTGIWNTQATFSMTVSGNTARFICLRNQTKLDVTAADFGGDGMPTATVAKQGNEILVLTRTP